MFQWTLRFIVIDTICRPGIMARALRLRVGGEHIDMLTSEVQEGTRTMQTMPCMDASARCCVLLVMTAAS